MSRQYTHNGHTSEVIRPDLTDVEVANSVRMLMRGDLDHEMVCCMARDRILCLTQENAKLQDRVMSDGEETLRLVQALQQVVFWSSKAEDERQQSGPVMRDYLAYAAKAAVEAINSVKTPASP